MSVGRSIARGLARAGSPQGLAPWPQRVAYDEAATYRLPKRARVCTSVDRDRGIITFEDREVSSTKWRPTSVLDDISREINKALERFGSEGTRPPAENVTFFETGPAYTSRSGPRIVLDALALNVPPRETAEHIRSAVFRESVLFGDVVCDDDSADFEELRRVAEARDDYPEIVRWVRRLEGA